MQSNWKPEITWIKPESLRPYDKNNKKHPQEQIDQIMVQIHKRGFTQPILVDDKNLIIAGHGRLQAALQLGLDAVPVIVAPHLSGEDGRLTRIADNKVAKSEDDLLNLRIELQELDDLNCDLSLTGFTLAEIEDILIPEKHYEDKDPDAVPEIKENQEAITKPGDIIILGDHRLMCGDCTDEKDIQKLFNGSRATFCFTSPPYSDQRDYGGNLNLDPLHLAKFLKAPCDLFAVNLGLKRKDHEVVEYWQDYILMAKEYGHKFLSWNVWNKGVQGSVGTLTAMFPIAHEWLFIFGNEKKLNKTIKNKASGQKRDVADRQKDGSIKSKPDVTVSTHRAIGTVYDGNAELARNHGVSHPAMFPVHLPEEYIKACSDPGDFIFEPFAGSGTTCIAAEKTDRKALMLEIDPLYCDIIIKRWEEFTGKRAERQRVQDEMPTLQEVTSAEAQ